MDLQELRTQIDRVDNNLLSLIIERRNLVQTVAEYKRDNQLPIFAPEREEQILKRLDEHGPHVHGIGGIRLLYGILMDLNTLSEYQTFPKDLPIPTRLGGASVRAILSDNPGALCR
ncbi:MAG: chorismate mutase, partial [Oscillospiraceae bacterium]